MQYTLKKVRRDKCRYPSQPRSRRDPEHVRGLSASMKSIGQKVPILGYTEPVEDLFIVTDGGSRVAAAELADIPELLALDLGKKPTQEELLMGQAAIDQHHQHLPPMDRAVLWEAIRKERGCTAREMAKELHVDESLFADYVSLNKLPSDVQEQVNSGELSMSKAALIAQQESDPDRQRELAALAKDVPREQLATKLRQARREKDQKPAVSAKRIKIELASATVTISGANLTLDAAIEAVLEAGKEMKRGQQQGLTAKTIQKISSDRARVAG
jgi:ParB family transcriptional regulator, chromosome partitioning protein